MWYITDRQYAAGVKHSSRWALAAVPGRMRLLLTRRVWPRGLFPEHFKCILIEIPRPPTTLAVIRAAVETALPGKAMWTATCVRPFCVNSGFEFFEIRTDEELNAFLTLLITDEPHFEQANYTAPPSPS
jgi:hypothetical protein